mmetsp:Transcript_10832/g.46133  ORF Transcript_10832/g.46133 Transcript_10832/m.46133 type:complete len:270 (+) Transcript_10832:55-864(+)
MALGAALRCTPGASASARAFAARFGSSMATSGVWACLARSARCERCGSAWQSRMPTTPGPQVVTSSSPSAEATHTIAGSDAESDATVGSVGKSRSTHTRRAPFTSPGTMQSQPASPVAARAARSKCDASFALWNTTDARIWPSVNTSTTCWSMPSARPSAPARPSNKSESIAQWSSAARRARSATARERSAPSSPPGGMPPGPETASSDASCATPANSPPPPPAETATASAAAARKSSAARCSAALISLRGGSASAPSALMPRLSNTNA